MELIEEQKEAARLRGEGLLQIDIASRMGLSRHAVQRRLRAWDKWQEADPSIRDTSRQLGLADVSRLSHYWDKVELPDGRSVSAFIKNDVSGENGAEFLETVASAFDNVRPVNIPPANVYNDLITVYPLYDMHIGMMAWARETRGQDYNLELMKSDLMKSIATVQSYAPDSQEALIILGGDTIHVNDHYNETPASKHHQDTDGRFEKVTDTAIEAIAWAIEYLASKHKSVKVIVLRGNHDETSHIVLKSALKQRYRNSDNVEFPSLAEWDKSEIYWLNHGKSLIIMHHGDKAPPERLALIAADKCPHWSECKYRVILTGHVHSLKVKDMAGVTHYSLRAFCPPDAYGANFGGVRGLSAMSFSAVKGLINTAHDPVERD